MPRYLKEEHFGTLKSNIERLEIINGNAFEIFEKIESNHFTKLNLSNIVEWFDFETFKTFMKLVHKVATPNSPIIYRYTLANRKQLDEELQELFRDNEERNKELKSIDKSFMYNHIIEHTVLK
jgi:S-adenosylmethionine:diacylglycerol 3-amino-3-carboxypropyl transferase